MDQLSLAVVFPMPEVIIFGKYVSSGCNCLPNFTGVGKQTGRDLGKVKTIGTGVRFSNL